MKLIEELSNQLDHLNAEFAFLIEENKKLRQQIEDMQTGNEILNRDTQDMIMSIKSKLQREREGEEDHISHQ